MTPSAPVTLGTAAGSTVTTLTPGALAAVNVDLTLAGRFEGIQKFVNDLESADRYTLATGLNIAEDDEDASGKLVATINARIFVMPVVDEDATTATIPGAPAATASPTPTATPAP